MRIYPYSAIPHRLSDAGDRDIQISRIFESLAIRLYILIKKEQQIKSNKIASRAEIGILVGYKSHNI
jgi:hypothetical protein